MAGVSQCLSKIHSSCKCVLADPQGSSLFNKVKYGACYTPLQAETRLKRHRYDSIVEGVGLDRVTANFKQAIISEAVCVSDQDMVSYCYSHGLIDS